MYRHNGMALLSACAICNLSVLLCVAVHHQCIISGPLALTCCATVPIPTGRVGDGAACIMRAIAECGAAAAAPMREASLREGAILQHLHRALYGPKAKAGLSRELVASWADQYAPAIALLRRVSGLPFCACSRACL